MTYIVAHQDGHYEIFDNLTDAVEYLKSELFKGVPQDDIGIYKSMPYNFELAFID